MLLRPLSCRFTLPLLLFPLKQKQSKETGSFSQPDKIWQAYTEETAVREVGCGITSLS